jgi:beta-glucanase (GH16 family)
MGNLADSKVAGSLSELPEGEHLLRSALLRFGWGIAFVLIVVMVTVPLMRIAIQPSGMKKVLPVPVGQDGDWRLIFSDEFNGDTIDLSRWALCYWWDDEGCTNEGNNELQWYLPEDVLLDGGHLRLRARQNTIHASNGRTYPYSSGMVTTGPAIYDEDASPGFAFLYGYVEARVHIPRGTGLWPAFWLLPADIFSGNKPEIDVFEFLGDTPDTVRMHFHFLDETGEAQHPGQNWVGPDFSEDWHTFAVDWQPDVVIWYVDGIERWRVSDASRLPTADMYLLLNLAVGGDWPGPPDESASFPSYFDIDYVRIWERQVE